MFSSQIMSCDFAIIRFVALSQILYFGAADLNVAIKSTLQGYSNIFLSTLEDSSPFLTRNAFPAQLRRLAREILCSIETLADECSPSVATEAFIPSPLDLHAPFLPLQGSPSC